MIWIALGLWVGGSVLLGLPIARLAMREERRTAVHLAFGLLAGHSLQFILMVVLWGWFALATALYITLSISSLAGIVLLLAGRWRHLAGNSWGLRTADTLLVVASMLGLAIVSCWLATLGYTALERETLYWHSALVGWIQRTPYPPSSPLEPDTVLRYRFGLHALAAAVSSASSTPPAEAMAATMAVLTSLLVPALCGASLRLAGSVRPGLIAALLGFLGGSLLPWYRFAQALMIADPGARTASMLDAFGNYWRQGPVWGGNYMDLLVLNPSVSAAVPVLAGALWFLWGEAVAVPRPQWLMPMLALAALAYLGFAYEVYFVAVAGGLVAIGALRSLGALLKRQRQWYDAGLLSLCLVVGSYAVVSLRGGLLGGLSMTAGGGNSLHLVFNTSRLGLVTTAPFEGGQKWVPLLSTDVLVDSDFWMLAVPILLVLAWRKGNYYSSTGLLASATAYAAWVLIYPGESPSDAFRFGNAAFVILLLVGPIALAAMPGWYRFPWPRVRFWATAMTLMALTTPHIITAAALAAFPPVPTQAVPGRPDYAAIQLLKGSTDTWRVLVPLESKEGGWLSLYGSTPSSVAMRSVLGLSEHAIPMGHQSAFFDPAEYLPRYRTASFEFDRQSLESLKIDWVYVLPAYLNEEQQSNLSAAKERGDLRLEMSFGKRGSPDERLLFRINPE